MPDLAEEIAVTERLDDGDSRTLIRCSDSGDLLARVLAFSGTSKVRIVIERELERNGFTLHYEEAVAWRDALTQALAEIDDWHASLTEEAR